MHAPRVLIIDDSEGFRALLRKRLELLGFEISAEAGSGREGLNLFRTIKPDLITLDLMMPDSAEFSSKELFRLIRSESPKTPVVVISVSGRLHNEDDFLQNGALAYLEKSFLNYEQFAKILRQRFTNLRPPSGGLRGRVRSRPN